MQTTVNFYYYLCTQKQESMIRSNCLLAILLYAVFVSADTQMPFQRYRSHQNDNESRIMKSYNDSITVLKSRLDSIYSVRYGKYEQNIENSYLPYNGTFYKLFIPLTFYHSTANKYLRISSDRRGKDNIEDVIDATLLNIYINKPELIICSQDSLDKSGSLIEEFNKPKLPEIDLSENISPNLSEPSITPVEVFIKRPNFWTYKSDCYLQFIQNFVSGNWYKGGESNYSMVTSATIEANYNNKQKMKWDNKLEMKLGFQTSKGDTLHSFKPTEDLLRYTSKVGVQANNKWYYALQMIAYTQFFRGYKSNDSFVYSDFMSPFNFNISIGMDYTVEWMKKRLKGNIHLAPLAYNFRYVGRLKLAPRYGHDEGSNTKNELGSEVSFDLTWNFTDNIKWQSRLFAYTTYKRSELEWENTFTFKFNKYISTNLFLYPRFDDGTKRDKDYGYWQFKEYASLGFTLSF